MLLRREGTGLRRLAPVLATVIPLVVLLAITFTAASQKVFHADPNIGFFAAAEVNARKIPDLEIKAAAGDAPAAAALKTARTLVFNNRVDGIVTSVFLVLVAIISALVAWEWRQLLARRKPAELSETPPLWLDLPAGTPGAPAHALGIVALGFALLRDLSGQAALDREAQAVAQCDCAKLPTKAARQNVFLAATERRFSGVRRCC